MCQLNIAKKRDLVIEKKIEITYINCVPTNADAALRSQRN